MPSGSCGFEPSYEPSKWCGSGGKTVNRLAPISPQSRSGGGEGMHTSGYDGSQLAALPGLLATGAGGGATVGGGSVSSFVSPVASVVQLDHNPYLCSRANRCASRISSTYCT